LDESIENCPATAGYGDTTQSAAESLLTRRFGDEKARPNAVAISIWPGSAVRPPIDPLADCVGSERLLPSIPPAS
jgi:hypothetical protein